ncbi:MAG: hypothetical protein ACTSRG_26750 [Candidatus Helarchaeota archaeon]
MLKLWKIRSNFSKKKIKCSIILIFLCSFLSTDAYSTLYFNEKIEEIVSNNTLCHSSKVKKSNMNSFFNIFYKNIIFDTSHHQVWSIWDTGYIGLSDLAILLINNSFYVSASTRFLNETIPNLDNDSIIVLNVGRNQNYTDQEVDLLEKFVYQGGSILVLGEHDDYWKMSTFQNKLLTKFNMSINFDFVEDNSSYFNTTTWIVFNSSFFNLNNITFYGAASLTLGSGAVPIAVTSSNSSPSNAIVGARCEYGKGRVICVTDTEFIWNGDDEIGIRLGNNTSFTLSIFEWLANKSRSSSNIQIIPEYSLFTANFFPLNLSTNGIYNITTEIYGGIINPSQLINAGTKTTWNITVNKDGYIKFKVNNSEEERISVVYFFKPNNPTHSIFISEINFSRRIDQSISGLYNFAKYLKAHKFSVFASTLKENLSNYDAVCISNPLQNISNSQILNLLSSKRLLVLGESYTKQTFGLNNPTWNPINSLLMNFDTYILHYLICDNISNYGNNVINPKIKGNYNLEFIAYQSSVVNTTNPNLKILAGGKSSSWGEDHSSLGDWLDFAPLSYNFGDIKDTPLILYNSNIMVIGDTDVITNERGGDAILFHYLSCWLKTGTPYSTSLNLEIMVILIITQNYLEILNSYTILIFLFGFITILSIFTLLFYKSRRLLYNKLKIHSFILFIFPVRSSEFKPSI